MGKCSHFNYKFVNWENVSILITSLGITWENIPIFIKSLVISCKNVPILIMPEFLKTGLAKIRAHSTTWQIKNNKIRPKADKKAYIGRRAISLCPWKHSHESKFKMTQIFEHLFSNLTSGEVSKRNHFSLEIFS